MKDEKLKTNRFIYLRVTAEEHSKIQEDSIALGISMNSFLRSIIFKPTTVLYAVDQSTLFREIDKIGLSLARILETSPVMYPVLSGKQVIPIFECAGHCQPIVALMNDIKNLYLNWLLRINQKG